MTECILQSGEKGQLRFQHSGHWLSPKLKPCCRGIPLSHLRPDEVLSVHFNKHRCQWIVAVPTCVLGLSSWGTRVHRVSFEKTWASSNYLTTNGQS